MKHGGSQRVIVRTKQQGEVFPSEGTRTDALILKGGEGRENKGTSRRWGVTNIDGAHYGHSEIVEGLFRKREGAHQENQGRRKILKAGAINLCSSNETVGPNPNSVGRSSSPVPEAREEGRHTWVELTWTLF